MAGIQSRVAITTDMWTSDNQKRGYMAITAHFIDESWNLRNILMTHEVLTFFLDLVAYHVVQLQLYIMSLILFVTIE